MDFLFLRHSNNCVLSTLLTNIAICTKMLLVAKWAKKEWHDQNTPSPVNQYENSPSFVNKYEKTPSPVNKYDQLGSHKTNFDL